jgi:hypothetical protein
VRTILASLTETQRNSPGRRFALLGMLFVLLAALSGCAMTLEDQPRFEAQEASRFFADAAASRPRIPDTVARGELRLDPLLTTGQVDGQFVDSFPFTITQTILERGQERYAIFCAPCHGLAGDGQGVITEYGMPQPNRSTCPICGISLLVTISPSSQTARG